MESAGFELFSNQSQAVPDDVDHDRYFLIRSVALHGMEHDLLFCFNGPSAESQAKLDVCLDFSCMESAVEKPEFNGTFGEVRVKVESMVPGFIVVGMIDPSTVVIVLTAVPDLLQRTSGEIFLFPDAVEQLGANRPAPLTCSG